MPPPNALPDASVTRFRADLERLTGGAPDAAAPLGIAVSGGPDSVALLLLADAAYGPAAVRAATVDHGLRPAAAVEARFVAELCAARGIGHHILCDPAGGRPGPGGAQAWARHLRYRLLGEWAARHRLGWIATAHHADDQAETFLMRATRGAGVSGLAAIRACEPGLLGGGAMVVRPLLGWRRAELGALVAAAGIEAVDDPSNCDPAHDRTAFRGLIAAAPRLDIAGLAAAAANAAEAEAALDWTMAGLWDERARGDGASLTLAVDDLPREYRRRLVGRAIAALVPGARPRGAEIDRLLAVLEAGGTATLAGVKAGGGTPWCFRVAPPRRADRGA